MPTPPAASCCTPSTGAPARQVAKPLPEATTPPLRSDAAGDLQRGRDRLALVDALADARGFDAPKGAHTATILSRIPQYDRTHVQGCVCKPAIAGGACCPTSVGSMGLQQLTASDAAHHASPPLRRAHPSMGPLSGVACALAGFGFVSGLQVQRGAQEADRHLRAVGAQARARHQALAVSRERFSAHPGLQATAAAVACGHEAAVALEQDVAHGRAEQRFNLWVPGRLQMLSALGVLVTSGAHLLGVGSALLHGALAGAAVQGLFVLYGAAMAAKNLVGWWRDVASLQAPKALPGADAAYRAARATYARARRQQLAQTGAAWLAVSAASLWGAAVGLGAVALPHAGALAALCTAVAGAAAMYTNSCSRYAPHLPVSNHIERDQLTQTHERAALYGHLAQQQQLIVDTNAHTARLALPLERLRARIEQAIAPQCGAEAFMVLPRVAARTLAENGGAAPQAQKLCAQQLQAVTGYLHIERAIQATFADAARASLASRAEELAKLLEPTCPHKRRRTEAAWRSGDIDLDCAGDAAQLFDADTHRALQSVQRLAVIDALLRDCALLQHSDEPLAASAGAALTATQKRWLEVRFQTMQLCGILRDGLSAQFVVAHGAHIKTNPLPGQLPLGSIYPLPEAASSLCAATAQDIETLFVHAFFNPRRIEAVMDYLLAMEDHGPAQAAHGPVDAAQGALGPMAHCSIKTGQAARPFAAAAASAATCCS